MQTSVGDSRVIQFNVFLDNRVGRLLLLWEAFEGMALSLVGYSVLESTGHAVVRLIPSDPELARTLLHRCEYPFAEEEVLVAELGEDAGGGLTPLFESLMVREISIHYSYPLLMRPRGRATIAIHTDHNTRAAEALRADGFKILGVGELVE